MTSKEPMETTTSAAAAEQKKRRQRWPVMFPCAHSALRVDFFCCESRAGLPQSPSKSREDACTYEDNLVKGASAGLSVVYKHEWHALPSEPKKFSATNACTTTTYLKPRLVELLFCALYDEPQRKVWFI